MTSLQTYLPIAGRILMAIIFFMSGISKITDPGMNVGYMEAFGVPGILLWPTIIVEIAGAVMLIVGFQVRWAAAALAAFTLVAGVIFHTDFGNPAELINFMKNLAIIGGLLYVVAYGAGAFSMDQRKT
ncbi:DoxX family protein [Pelagibacterium lacus]|uniref:DoxX family protein n=1 Tax=Pelagibacterium lacus TaxID=2282655 RepID=A0A369W1T4_9HYPH|nr:DoxX family protein [Pelagibacterium lacus]RDE07989.1 DoxX family protein [Pelagibacterium lacus]